MDSALKEILSKPAGDITVEEREVIKDAVDVFQKEIADVCAKHGLAHRSVIKVSAEGIFPHLDIVPVADVEPLAPEVVA